MGKIIKLRPYRSNLREILLSAFTISLGIFLWSAKPEAPSCKDEKMMEKFCESLPGNPEWNALKEIEK